MDAKQGNSATINTLLRVPCITRKPLSYEDCCHDGKEVQALSHYIGKVVTTSRNTLTGETAPGFGCVDVSANFVDEAPSRKSHICVEGDITLCKMTHFDLFK